MVNSTVSVQNRLIKTPLTLETHGNNAVLGTKWSLKGHSECGKMDREKCYANEGSLCDVRLLHPPDEGSVR